VAVQRDDVRVVDVGVRAGLPVARADAGATVVTASGGPGKGQAMADGVAATTAEVVVFLDGDVTDPGPHYVTGLVGPLASNESVELVKGTYRRPLDGVDGEGGRVTELVARPLLRVLFPELVAVGQPLAGETAVRRRVLDRVGLADGYAVELALLVDTWRLHGLGAIAQVDLGVRHHRHQSLAALAVQAQQIIEAAVTRADRTLPIALPD
jgi:glucosyl-3-phosphoglycerate synthase